jgi:hypothetical protein
MRRSQEMKMTALPGTLPLLDLPIKACQRAQSYPGKSRPNVRTSPLILLASYVTCHVSIV